MSRARIPKALRVKVTAQARHRCGYCLTSQEYSGAILEIEHLKPKKLGGRESLAGMWLVQSLQKFSNSSCGSDIAQTGCAL